MTTNSPNPVDGDVQALIASLELKVKNLSDGWLKAIAERDEARKERGKLEAARAVRDAWKERAWMAEEKLSELEKLIANTTPPAQLLRPVVLPDVSAAKYYTEEGAFKAFDYKRDLKEAILKAGCEVKS